MSDDAVHGGHVVALADGFRAVIRGTEGRPKRWEPEHLGPLRTIVYETDGGWRPDALAATRILLRRIVGSYHSHGTGPGASAAAAHERAVVARYWGVSGYPVDPAMGNPFLDRGVEVAEVAEGSGGDPTRAEATDGTEHDEGPAAASIKRRMRRRAATIASTDEALAIAASGSELEPVVLDPEYWSARGASVGVPRWNTAAAQVQSWPPGLMPGEEGYWLLDRMAAHFDEEDPRLVAIEENPNARRLQLTQVLRRRASELHEAYLGDHEETQPHFFHLRHSMARQWFHTDLQDLGGVAERVVEFREVANSPARDAMLRSQAAIAQLTFFSVIHDWDEPAIDQILDRRSSARLVFLGVDELADPLERLLQSILASQRKIFIKGAKTTLAQPVPMADPVFVQSAGATARQLFHASLLVRDKTTRETVQAYIDARAKIEEADVWGPMTIHDKRTVLLADHAVHLDAVNLRLPGVMAQLDRFLATSSKVRSEYASYIDRDEAMLAGKGNTRRALERSVAAARRGASAVEEATHRAGGLFSTSAFNERAALETEHQMSLAMAGATVKVLEDYMESPAEEQATMSPDVVLNRIQAAMRWSAATMSALDRLESKKWLGDTRYHDGFLAVAAWRVPSKVIRHRILCAAFALKSAFGLHDRLPFPGVLDLDVAYIRMITEPRITDAHAPQVMQGALLHSFLTHGVLPFPGRIAPALRACDFLTMDADIDAIGYPRARLGVGRRMQATLFNVERNYDYGVGGRIPLDTRMSRTLNDLSDSGFSEWRRFLEVLKIQREHPERSYAFCFSCGHAGPTDPSQRNRCPRCGDIVAV